MSSPRTRTGLSLLGIGAALLAGSVRAGGAKTDGFLYARVTTESGSTYVGRVRWATEEAFWGDLFNSTKRERPYADEAPRGDRHRSEPIRIFGIKVGWRWSDYDEERVFKARFGDIREIRPRRGEQADVLMKSGTEFHLKGGSNDLGATIHVWDDGLGEVDLEWNAIDRIEFLPTPSDLQVDVHRLYGSVETDAGPFRGFIQWDQDEGLSSDKLDGSSRDGKLAIPMGNLRVIERHSRGRSSRVVLRDGRELVLDDSNDVDQDNRGIFVEDPRYGRVLVPWDAFERVEFSVPRDSGPSYDDFGKSRPLRGKVTDVDGNVHRGQIIYDLDESETWEMLDGDRRGVSYGIPFALVAAVVPTGRDASRVLLRSGEELELEDAADVGEGNAGIVVLGPSDSRVYVAWDRVQRVDFD